jgi:protoporphyrinogen oxidase
VWRADDADLGGLVRAALREADLTDPRRAGIVVRRLPRAYPVYEVGYEERFRRLDDWARRSPRLLTFGRQGLFVHDNSHHALAMAWAAAEGLGHDGRFDEEWWAGARERFAEHVVED